MFNYFLTDIHKKKWLFLSYIIVYSIVMIGAVVVMIFIMNNYCNQSKKNPRWNIYSVKLDSGLEKETYTQLKKEICNNFKNNIEGISGKGLVKMDNRYYVCSCYGYKDINKFYSSKTKPSEGEAISSGQLYEYKNQEVILQDSTGIKKGNLKIADNTELILSGDLQESIDLALSVEDFEYFCNEFSQIDITFCNHLNAIQLVELKNICRHYGGTLSYQKIWKWNKIIENRNYLIVFIITLLYAVLSVLFMKAYLFRSQKKNLHIYMVCGANPIDLKNVYLYIFTMVEILAWIIGFFIVLVMNFIIDFSLDIFPQIIICIAYGMAVWMISFPWIGRELEQIMFKNSMN